MSNLIPFNRPTMKRAESRELRRSLTSLEASSRLEIARIDQAAEVQAMRADAVAYVGKRALRNVALLTQLEQQMALMVPLASPRLQAIADMTAFSIAEVVSDTLHQVR